MNAHKGFKSVGNWVITLVPSEINNERRNVIDKNHAMFRCAEALVVSIEHRWDTTITPPKVVRSYYCGWDKLHNIYHLDTPYKVGEITKCDEWNYDIDKYCTHGIHYYLDKNTARCYRCFKPDEFTGNWELYNPDGKPRGYQCGKYLRGKFMGVSGLVSIR